MNIHFLASFVSLLLHVPYKYGIKDQNFREIELTTDANLSCLASNRLSDRYKVSLELIQVQNVKWCMKQIQFKESPIQHVSDWHSWISIRLLNQ